MIHHTTKCATEMTCLLCEQPILVGARAEVYTHPDHFVLCETCYRDRNAEVLAAVNDLAASKAQAVVAQADASEAEHRAAAVEAIAEENKPGPLPEL